MKLLALRRRIRSCKSSFVNMWDWHNNEITKAGGLTFKASSLIAKALHPELHAKRGGQAGSVQGVLGVEGRQGRGAAALVGLSGNMARRNPCSPGAARRPIWGTPQTRATRPERVCSVLNISGARTDVILCFSRDTFELKGAVLVFLRHRLQSFYSIRMRNLARDAST